MLRQTSKFSQFYEWNQKITPIGFYMPNLMFLGKKNRVKKEGGREGGGVIQIFKNTCKISVKIRLQNDVQGNKHTFSLCYPSSVELC